MHSKRVTREEVVNKFINTLKCSGVNQTNYREDLCAAIKLQLEAIGTKYKVELTQVPPNGWYEDYTQMQFTLVEDCNHEWECLDSYICHTDRFSIYTCKLCGKVK
jgi:hypothetical protein